MKTENRRWFFGKALAGVTAGVCARLGVSSLGVSSLGLHSDRAWCEDAARRPVATRGPLAVDPKNRRYFADRTGRAILLAGSHTWNNLIEIGDPDDPFDYPQYLRWLLDHHHNFFRLWTWELSTWDTRDNIGSPKKVHRVGPLRYARSDQPGAAAGGNKFDLDRLDEDYFGRLRTRVKQAGDLGIYVSVMLFEGWGMQFSPAAWKHHPYHPDNNINGIGRSMRGDQDGLKIFTLEIPEITRLQERYIKAVVDAVHDLDNVLYEVSNENHPDSTAWQYHCVRWIRDYESSLGVSHPIGMTYQHQGGTNRALFESPADWISPNGEGGYKEDPPAADGTKVIVNDTDHLWGTGGEVSWVWKSFTRGHNLLLMDPYDEAVLAGPSPQWQAEPIRKAMGQASLIADSLDLASFVPQPDLSSTGYCLANDEGEMIVYCPSPTQVKVRLRDAPTAYRLQWIDASGDPSPDRSAVVSTLNAGGHTVIDPPFFPCCIVLRHG